METEKESSIVCKINYSECMPLANELDKLCYFYRDVMNLMYKMKKHDIPIPENFVERAVEKWDYKWKYVTFSK